MIKEKELVKPIVWHLCNQFSLKSKILIHEETELGEGRVDIIIIYTQPFDWKEGSIVVEIESSGYKAYCDEKHGIFQLGGFPATQKYLGIPPPSSYDMEIIKKKCRKRCFGLLIVRSNGVEEICSPVQSGEFSLGRASSNRWGSLIKSRDAIRWIKDRKIKWKGRRIRHPTWKEELKDYCSI